MPPVSGAGEQTEAGTPSSSGGGGGSVFTRKLGPLPVWAWMGIALGVALAYSLWRKNKASATANANTATSTPADQTPPFIIQNYTTFPPGPGAPAQTPTTPTPPSPSGPGVIGTPAVPSGEPPIFNQPAGPHPGPIRAPSATPPSTPTSAPKKPYTTIVDYKVKPGDTLTSIAAKYGISEQHLWQFNITPGVRSDKDRQTLLSRGQNLIYPNEDIYVPVLVR